MTKIKIYFYQLRMPPETALRFEDILRQVVLLPAEDKTVTVNHTPVFLHQASEQAQFWQGDIIRLRMSNIPVKGSLSGTVDNIGLDIDEGLGEQTAFLYHPRTRVLVLQSSKSGVSDSAFAKYFQDLSNIQNPIEIFPILQPDAYRRIQRMGVMRSFTVRVAGLDNMQLVGGEDDAVRQIAALSEIYRAPEVEINVSTGGARNESLARDNILRTVGRLLQWPGQNQQRIKKLVVSGADDDVEEVKPVDLLSDKMQAEPEVAQNGDQRTLTYFTRRDAVHRAWAERQVELSQMFGTSV